MAVSFNSSENMPGLWVAKVTLCQKGKTKLTANLRCRIYSCLLKIFCPTYIKNNYFSKKYFQGNSWNAKDSKNAEFPIKA